MREQTSRSCDCRDTNLPAGSIQRCVCLRPRPPPAPHTHPHHPPSFDFLLSIVVLSSSLYRLDVAVFMLTCVRIITTPPAAQRFASAQEYRTAPRVGGCHPTLRPALLLVLTAHSMPPQRGGSAGRWMVMCALSPPRPARRASLSCLASRHRTSHTRTRTRHLQHPATPAARPCVGVGCAARLKQHCTVLACTRFYQQT